MNQTPIEVVCSRLSQLAHVSIDEILVPEQCASIFIGSVNYHITAQLMPHSGVTVGEQMAQADEVMANMAKAFANFVMREGGWADECEKFFVEQYRKALKGYIGGPGCV